MQSSSGLITKPTIESVLGVVKDELARLRGIKRTKENGEELEQMIGILDSLQTDCEKAIREHRRRPYDCEAYAEKCTALYDRFAEVVN